MGLKHVINIITNNSPICSSKHNTVKNEHRFQKDQNERGKIKRKEQVTGPAGVKRTLIIS